MGVWAHVLTPFVLVGTSRRKRKSVRRVQGRCSNRPAPDPFRADQIRAWSEAVPRYAFASAVIAGAWYVVAHGDARSGLGLLLAIAYRIWPKPK